MFDPAALRHIITSFGASQIVVGSDYPFNLGDPDPMGTIDIAGLDSGIVRAIVYENAGRFLGRKLES